MFEFELVRRELFGEAGRLYELQDYNNKLAQLRAGKSSKSKLTLAKFKTPESLQGWEVYQGTYFQDVVASKYDGGMDAKFEFTFTGDAVFSGNKTPVGKWYPTKILSLITICIEITDTYYAFGISFSLHFRICFH